MGFGFLNAWMLIGLAAAALPIAVHLISKRRFNVVHWGAMRFLELGQRTRRRFRLQDILLLLLRMGLLACLALALARPWGSGTLLGSLGAEIQHDYVFILDGSTSMAWQGTGQPGLPPQRTPYQQAVQWIFEALEDLSPGDTVALIDARNQPRRLIAPPVTDRKIVRDILTGIAEPAGTSQLPEAIEDALKILATTANVSRRVIVLSDDQAMAWKPEDEFAWTRVDELRKQPQVTPVINTVTFGGPAQARTNYSVGRIELSREVTVPEFPVKVRAMIRQSGGDGPSRKRVSFQIDGQQVPGKTLEVNLLPNGEAMVEFEHVFPAVGNFLACIALDPDELPNDDRADAVIAITTSIPVLLVDGEPHIDPTRSETFYVQSAFSASGSQSPWIQARVIRPLELDESLLAGQQVIFLCNVERLTQRQWASLRKFVRDGGGLVLAPGEKVNSTDWNSIDQHEKIPFLPAQLREIVQEKPIPEAPATTIDSLSLNVPWLQRFRQENDVDLSQTRFLKWWRLKPVHHLPSSNPAAVTADTILSPPQNQEEPPPQILARLSQGDPWLIRREYGHGSVLQLAIPLDADWSTLPAKNDFVPFLHELVFSLINREGRRNVDVETPLLLALKQGESVSDFVVNGPGVQNVAAEPVQRGRAAFAEFRQTSTPGVYRFQKREDVRGASEPFVVDDDHRESDLTPLTADQWKVLTQDGRFQAVKTMREVAAATRAESPRTELWWLLLLLVLLMLVCEIALTRKMVQGGHSAIETVIATTISPGS